MLAAVREFLSFAVAGAEVPLENKLAELLGNQVWRESGLGAPADIEQQIGN
ncbi:hypothetical protein [Streptomyces olivochromogenes]|uniref:hypothetical protein n=1 Tax=Streptomyces olivochromogenes TaxID=1963 RepID=UPI0036BB93A6